MPKDCKLEKLIRLYDKLRSKQHLVKEEARLALQVTIKDMEEQIESMMYSNCTEDDPCQVCPLRKNK